jgi:hypothetical protein
MEEHVWDGTTRLATLPDWAAKARLRLADCAKRYDWQGVFDVLEGEPDFVNSSRPDSDSWYAPLHQAAHGGAPVQVVTRLIEYGAWRGLRNASGERPIDITRRRGHSHLFDILEPPRRIDVPTETLRRIQVYFHAVIRVRAQHLVDEHALRPPELEVMLELENPQIWFPVPGMHGGFKFRLEPAGADSRLLSDSWCRVVEGSEERHEITANGVTQRSSQDHGPSPDTGREMTPADPTDSDIIAQLSAQPAKRWNKFFKTVDGLTEADINTKWQPAEKGEDGVISIGFPLYSDAIMSIMKLLYDLKVVFPFDWIRWAEAHEDVVSPRLANASIADVCRMTTVILRRDPFSDGRVAQALADGTLPTIFQRLRHWYDHERLAG